MIRGNPVFGRLIEMSFVAVLAGCGKAAVVAVTAAFCVMVVGSALKALIPRVEAVEEDDPDRG